MADLSPPEVPSTPNTVPKTLSRRFVWAATPLVLTVLGIAVSGLLTIIAVLYSTGHIAYARSSEARMRVHSGMNVAEVRRAVAGFAEVTHSRVGPQAGVATLRTRVFVAECVVTVHLDSEGRVTGTEPPEYADD